jgi:hypothetical protein
LSAAFVLAASVASGRTGGRNAAAKVTRFVVGARSGERAPEFFGVGAEDCCAGGRLGSFGSMELGVTLRGEALLSGSSRYPRAGGGSLGGSSGYGAHPGSYEYP